MLSSIVLVHLRIRAKSWKLAVACLRVNAHYLDIAGEVPEFQALQSLDIQAQEAEVMLLPGVGFGIVPSDGPALHLKTLLPTATQLSLAFQVLGGVSTTWRCAMTWV